MLHGGAAGAGTVRAGIDRESPEHRGRFRKGFPARSEEASPAVRAEGCRGRGVSPGFSPRCRAGAPGDDETAGVSLRSRCPRTASAAPKFAKCLGAGGERGGGCPGGAPPPGPGLGSGRAERGASPQPRCCRGCRRSERRPSWGAALRRSPRRRCGRPGALLP